MMSVVFRVNSAVVSACGMQAGAGWQLLTDKHADGDSIPGPVSARRENAWPSHARVGGANLNDVQPNSLLAVRAISSPWCRAPASSIALGWR
jgi:hypothetical protein